MKRLNIFSVSVLLLLLLGAGNANCCITPYDYAWRWRCNVYRVYDPDSGLKFDLDNPEVKQNCESYHALTSPDISWKHIYTVVYRYSLEDMQGLLKRRSDNQFVRYINEHNDKELADYLLLAKRCEVVRLGMLDPWHYPPNEDSELEEILSEALDYRGTRLADRYLLQAIRALMSLKRYADIVALWQAGEAKVLYGIGLKNSFDACWALTQYHRTRDDDWLESKDRENALDAARSYIRSGLSAIRDR